MKQTPSKTVFFRRMNPAEPEITLLEGVDLDYHFIAPATKEFPWNPEVSYTNDNTDYFEWGKPMIDINKPWETLEHARPYRIPVSTRWRFTYENADKSTLSKKFSRYNKNSLINTEKLVDRHLDILKEFRKDAEDVLDPSNPIDAGEIDKLNGLGVQKGKNPGWWLPFKASPVLDMPSDFRIAVRGIIELYDRMYKRLIQEGLFKQPEPPMDTNGGWPTFTSGPVPKFISAMLAGDNFESTLYRGQRFSEEVGIAPVTAFASGINPRITASMKEIPLVYFKNDQWEQVGVTKGLIPRNRQTWMSPMAFTVALDRLAARLKSCRYALGKYVGGTWHDVEGMAKYFPNNKKFSYECDFSGFDLSVSYEMQRVIAEEMLKAWPELGAEIEFWLKAEQMPFITPDRFGEDGFATLFSKRGQTSSGLILTTAMGTLICLASTVYALSKTWNVSIKQIIRMYIDHDFYGAFQGDDAKLDTDREIDSDTYEAAMSTLGLKAEMIEGHRFLAKHMLIYQGTPVMFPIGPRIPQQSFFPERPPDVSDEISAITIAVIGFAARWSDGPYPKMKPIIEKAMKKSILYEKTQVYNGATARLWLIANADLVTKVLEGKAAMSWIEKTIAAADYSQTAYQVLKLMSDEGIVPEAEILKSKSILKMLYSKLEAALHLERGERFNLAIEMYEYLIGSYELGIDREKYEVFSDQVRLISSLI